MQMTKTVKLFKGTFTDSLRSSNLDLFEVSGNQAIQLSRSVSRICPLLDGRTKIMIPNIYHHHHRLHDDMRGCMYIPPSISITVVQR